MSKKKKLAAVLAALAFCAGMAGCGDEASSEKTFTYGTMAYGVAMENAGTNPHDSYTGWSTVRYGVGETLFRFNERMELEPWLAERYEQADDNTVKIYLKPQAAFSNGRKVTGEKVKECLEDLLAKHDRAPKDLKIDSITADEESVTIHSAEKVPALLNYLSDPYGAIVDVEAGEHDRIVIGTGPYEAVSVTDTEIQLKKNENYWGESKPKMDKIIVRSITDGDTLTMAMQNGELDAVQGLPYSSLQLFAADTEHYAVSAADTSRTYQIAMNFHTPELQDVRVRRAIAHAVDKQGFTDVLLHGNGTAAAGPFPANLAFGDTQVKAPGYDLASARALLAEAGYQDTDGDGYVDKNGKNLELRYLTYTSRQELPLLAESVQAALKKIGVKLNINATDNYRTFLKNGDYDMFAKAIVTAPTGDPEYYFTSHVLTGAVDNKGFYDSPKVMELAYRLHNTFGAEERSRLAVPMVQQVLDDAAIIYAAHLKMSFVMKKGVTGFMAHPSDYYEITPELDKK